MEFDEWYAKHFPDGCYCDDYNKFTKGHIRETFNAGRAAGLAERPMPVNIIFDGPPSHESGRFIEVETDNRTGINLGEWIERDDGLWSLRITELPAAPPAMKEG